MAYIVKSSERLRKIGAETETKALLYLMNFISESNEIYYFVVDFFNDLTGMDKYSTKLWDLQSKGNKNVSPKDLGRELVTLYKNYLSELEFHAYILFVESVSTGVRIDSSKDVFDYSNVNEKALKSIKEGLKEESQAKEYINDTDIDDNKINEFIKKITFVIGSQHTPAEYVKAIIKNHPRIIPDEKTLIGIFNEIRDKQSEKKNINIVENITIETSQDALLYFRHLTSIQIKMLTLQRIINRNPLELGIPRSFIPIYNTCPPEHQKDFLQECQSTLCRALFDKNDSESFWVIFETVYTLILNNPNDDPRNIYDKLKKTPNCIEKCTSFDALSLQYFISTIKDGIQQ